LGFRLFVLKDDALRGNAGKPYVDDWPQGLTALIPDIEVDVCDSVSEAMEHIQEADAAFGNIVPDLFARAGKLRWIAYPQAGPKAGYYHRALVESDVIMTNARGIYDDYIGAHIMAFVLFFARRFHQYVPQQRQGLWRRSDDSAHLPDATAVMVGVGGIGAEAARLCSEFGMT